jgi:hypothetical protein
MVPEPDLEQEQEQLTANTEVVEEPAEFYGRPLTPVDANFLAGLPQMSELTEAGVFEETSRAMSKYMRRSTRCGGLDKAATGYR